MAADPDELAGERVAPAARLELAFDRELRAEVDAALRSWDREQATRRLWSGDASLWTGGDEGDWLGWLHVAEDELERIGHLDALAADVREARFTRALLLGMGGSSLAPEMWARTFGYAKGSPRLCVLDSTDPAQLREVERDLPLDSTLFIVSSKSGSTLEPTILEAYFFERVTGALGPGEAPRRFLAVTDPGSGLEQRAREAGFRAVVHGVPSIGGRYSALSSFGIVPAAVAGLDVRTLLERAVGMARWCGPEVAADANPGVVLGAAMGTCAARGRDKVTLVASPAVAEFGSWAEQLLAESTGKQGHGIVPVAREPLGVPAAYGDDRLFVHLRLDDEPDREQDEAVTALAAAGHPVVRIAVGDRYDLGGEVFRWELATAVAGALIGIDPFDQPDVEASKVATRELTEAFEESGELPVEQPLLERDGVAVFAGADDVGALGAPSSLEDALGAHLARARQGDYVGLLAYLPMLAEHAGALAEMRRAIRDATGLATVDGFGPRFLHSTGQAFKGGPNTGVFLQITCDHLEDVAVPGRRYTFGLVEAAQARGDLAVLAERGRRVLRVHLADPGGGLATVARALTEALARTAA